MPSAIRGGTKFLTGLGFDFIADHSRAPSSSAPDEFRVKVHQEGRIHGTRVVTNGSTVRCRSGMKSLMRPQPVGKGKPLSKGGAETSDCSRADASMASSTFSEWNMVVLHGAASEVHRQSGDELLGFEEALELGFGSVYLSAPGGSAAQYCACFRARYPAAL